jgi:hypothetical protein
MRFISLISILCLSSCVNPTVNKTIEKLNDTSEVIRIAVDSAFNGGYLPDLSYLNWKSNSEKSILTGYDSLLKSQIGDSIITWYDSLLIQHLPNIKNVKLKLMTEDQICTLAYHFQLQKRSAPNFLKLDNFKQTIDANQITLANNCPMPMFNTDGTAKMMPDGERDSDTTRCSYEYLCGGAFTMSFKKSNNILTGKVLGYDLR